MTTKTVSDIVNRAEVQLPEINVDAPFLYTSRNMLSYRKLSIWSQQLEQQLSKHWGNQTDKPVIILTAQPSNKTICLIAAAWLLGWKMVPLSTELTTLEVEQRTKQLSVDLVLTDEQYMDQTAALAHQVFIDELPSPFEISSGVDTGWESDDWQTRRMHDPHSIFGYFFTSGTTGQPKCVPLRRRQMLSGALDAPSVTTPDTGEAWLQCLPIHHIGGYSLILRCLLYGAAVYAQPAGFETEEVADLLAEDERIVLVSLVPTMLRRLLKIDDFSVHQQFKSVLLGGALTPPELIEEAVEREIPVTVSYGMTETCAQIASKTYRDQFDLSEPLNTVGHLFPSNKLSIRIDLSDPGSQDGNGYIWLRGPQVLTQYVTKSETASAFDEEGWFNTGDLGHTDNDGQLYIASRRTDLIITGGENVRPQHVEQTILKVFDSIDSCAVIGQKDEEWGQRIVAVCVMDTDAAEVPPSILELRKQLKKELQSYELPRAVTFVEELPRTSSGKIKRMDLLEQVDSGTLKVDEYDG